MHAYTTAQATRIAGFRSPMMVDYLCRMGVVVPSVERSPGRGRSRQYNFGDLVLLRAMRRLLESGLPVSRLRGALETQRKKFADLGPETRIEKYLITDGKNVFLRNETSAIVDLNADGQMAFAFIVDIDQARADVVVNISKFGRKDARFQKTIRRRKQNTVSATK